MWVNVLLIARIWLKWRNLILACLIRGIVAACAYKVYVCAFVLVYLHLYERVYLMRLNCRNLVLLRLLGEIVVACAYTLYVCARMLFYLRLFARMHLVLTIWLNGRYLAAISLGNYFTSLTLDRRLL